ncbi:MAG: GDP-mannose 4,6-dehydratase [Lewinellaceae bacterium]|nr:GDP-mannose 4,6-dehydratase [Lewinellaceae bacterium]
MRVLVTGAAGFIGSQLCERLLQEGHTLLGLDNFDPFYDPIIKKDNIKNLLTQGDIQFVAGDIRDRELVQQIFTDFQPEVVVHLAAKAGVRPSIDSPEAYTAVNLGGTTTLLEAAHQTGVRRFLFASSSSVYGNQQKTPVSETDGVGFPISPYAATKRSGELLCHVYHHLYSMEIACLRFFTVYGPRQRPDLAIHKFTHLALHNKPIPIYGNGRTRRDYTYIDDILDGISGLLFMPELGYEIVNIGNGNPVHLLDMVEALEQVLNQKIKLEFTGMQAGDVEQTFADIRKANQLFGYQPKVSLAEGVAKFVAWYQGKF